jgi:hypothetical protein
MNWLDTKSPEPGGGTAASGGHFYHLSFRSGARASGACAHASYDYIAREGEYANGDRDPAIDTESDYMPSWAADRPGDYWDAADLYERANGRLYVSADFALPRDLSSEDQIALAREFAQELTRDESLPYTLAIHDGRDSSGHEHNPHAHLMISERKNDGIERGPEQWFSRANPADPAKGGAEKTRTLHGRAWVEHARERLAELTNKTMERLGREERVDHRSYARQGVDAEAGRHFGPAAAHMVSRGEGHDRLEVAVSAVTDHGRLQAVDRAIAGLETERQALMADDQKRTEWEWASCGTTGSGGGSGRDHDESRSR